MKSNRESFYEASSPNLFNISKERDPNPADSDDLLIMNSVSKYERVTILWNTELERDSETSYTSRQNTMGWIRVRIHKMCNLKLMKKVKGFNRNLHSFIYTIILVCFIFSKS